jgi:hypothetical protein
MDQVALVNLLLLVDKLTTFQMLHHQVALLLEDLLLKELVVVNTPIHNYLVEEVLLLPILTMQHLMLEDLAGANPQPLTTKFIYFI